MKEEMKIPNKTRYIRKFDGIHRIDDTKLDTSVLRDIRKTMAIQKGVSEKIELIEKIGEEINYHQEGLNYWIKELKSLIEQLKKENVIELDLKLKPQNFEGVDLEISEEDD